MQETNAEFKQSNAAHNAIAANKKNKTFLENCGDGTKGGIRAVKLIPHEIYDCGSV